MQSYENPPTPSSEQPEQAIPPRGGELGAELLRRAAAVDEQRIDAARDFAMRCAIYPQLRRSTPLLEVNPERMFHRIGWKITPAQERIYGCVLRARTLLDEDGEQFDGAWLAHEELALLARCDRTSSVRAIHGWKDRGRARPGLVELGVLQLVPQYRPPREVLAALGYTQERERNAYALGPAAWEPGPATSTKRRARGAPPPVDLPSTLPGKMSRLQTPEGEGAKPLSPSPDQTHARSAQLAQDARNPELVEPASPDRSAAVAASGAAFGRDPAAFGEASAGSGPVDVAAELAKLRARGVAHPFQLGVDEGTLEVVEKLWSSFAEVSP